MAKTQKTGDRESIYVERGYANDDPNAIVSVNGMMFLLPRGKTVEVPAFVAAEYRRSLRAKQRMDETMEKMLGK